MKGLLAGDEIPKRANLEVQCFGAFEPSNGGVDQSLGPQIENLDLHIGALALFSSKHFALEAVGSSTVTQLDSQTSGASIAWICAKLALNSKQFSF